MSYYFAANHIPVKLGQDYADFNSNGLILCDGIGEYTDSGKVSKLVVNLFNKETFEDPVISLQMLINSIAKEVQETEIRGGTTILTALKSNEPDKIRIAYLGNGGIIKLKGDFFQETISEIPYLYSNILLPHVNKNGALLRHLSFNSKETELLLTEYEVNTNSPKGDIIILFSDGIDSLENQFLIEDNQNRIWRAESSLIKELLKRIHQMLFIIERKDKKLEEICGELNAGLNNILNQFKLENLLDDDISIGIVLTDNVFKYYDILRKENDK